MIKTCWIVGASSGIGASLAKELSKKGYNLILSARNEKDLNQLANEIIGEVLVLPLDVCDLKSFTKAKEKVVRKFHNIDLAIFAPAIYKPMSVFDQEIEFAQKTMEINLGGCLNFLHLIAPIMRKQKSGQIALIASIAGYCGLPNSYIYGATKAAMINLAEGIRCELDRNNIKLSLVNPGFVDTRLTKQNQFKMPFIIDQDKAAKIIVTGLEKKKFEIHFPYRLTLILKFLRLVPYNIYFFITKRIN